MDYQLETHCPNCFKLSDTAICASCQFNRDAYLNNHAAAHHLPLFTDLEKGYLIGRVLGESSFAIVYAGIREKDQLACAIKEFYPRDLAQRSLDHKTVKPKYQHEMLLTWQNCFIQETELLRSCYDHPSVESGLVRYTGLIKQHNTAYLVMELLNGMSLATHLSLQKKLAPNQICLWLKPLLETLEKLHNKEIYHLNLSINNIFLVAADKPILMDFGLARAGLRDELLKTATLTSGAFIAPEQLTGGYCDQRTDLYALGAVLYLCLHGEAPPSVEARRQGMVLKVLDSTDKTAQALQTVATHCLQLNLNLRPKDAAYILTELTDFGDNQAAIISPRIESIVPSRYGEPPPRSRLKQTTNTAPRLRPPLIKPRSFLRGVITFFGTVIALLGLAYGGFMAYQDYEVKDAADRKQDNLLFSQAQSIADYKSYLTTCITCENQQRAMERIAQLELEQQSVLSQQKQQEQETLLFSKAETIEQLTAYLKSCVLCVEKPKAEEKLAQLSAATKDADTKQLAEQEKELATALKTESSSLNFYQQNCPKNSQFWQRTAEQGYIVAQLLSGGCYYSGNGVKQDYAESLKWYHRAAVQENVYAQNNLAMMYQNGYGTTKNDKEAAKWYIKAAEQGLANAQYSLGLMFLNGEGVTQDDKQAVNWFLRAAEQEHAEAQYSSGGMYHYGSGVRQDYQAALLWYGKAAKQGNDKAQYRLGVMYQNGYGVNPDEQAALNWYQKAAAQGNADAVAEIKTLEAMAMPGTSKVLGKVPDVAAIPKISNTTEAATPKKPEISTAPKTSEPFDAEPIDF